ncbi:MAG TPA: portal protein [Pyrinomonadaceae bacterium]|nr:portal protein [Pyrinomonadaceae bacterium]
MARHSEKIVCEISEKAWTDKQAWDDLLKECYEFALSDRNPYWGNGTGKPGDSQPARGKDKTSRRVYDSTLAVDAVRIANRLQYELFPIGSKWAEFQPGPFVQANVREQARGELENLREVVFAAIALSNFDLSIAEWLLELVVAGMACMLVQRGDEDNPVIYQCVTQAHVAVREGAFGKIDMISRKHKMRYSLVTQTWRDAKFKDLPEDKIAEDPELELVDVCYWSSTDKVWFYDVIVTSGVGKDYTDKRIVERQHDICPWVIARWSKAAGEAQGRSMVMLALPDARVLSSVKSYLLRHAALAIGGVWMVRNDGVINANNVRIFPGATIPVRSTGGSTGGASIAPLQATADVNLAQLVIQDLVGSIHKIMLNDGMPEIKDGVRTATELLERLKELQQSMGAPFSRVLKEGIIPMLEATISILGEMGVIPIAKGAKLKLNNGQVQVRFASPLVQGQSIRDVEVLQQAATVTAGMAGQEAVAVSFKVEDVGAWVGAKLGVDPTIMRNQKERVAFQQKAAQVLAAQQGAPIGPGGGVAPAANANATATAPPIAA